MLRTAKGYHSLRPEPNGGRRAGKRAVFLDRDGTLIFDRPGFYLNHPSQIRFYKGVPEALKSLADAGFELVVVSNQSGIARGFLDEPMLRRIHRRLLGELRRRGVKLAGIYYCPHGPDDRCSCRKPSAKLALRAVRRHGLELSGSFMVGDKRADVELGRALRIPSVLLLTGHGRRQRRQHGSELRPDHVSRGLREAAAWILRSRKA